MDTQLRKDLDKESYKNGDDINNKSWNLFGDLLKEVATWDEYRLEISPATVKGFQWYTVADEPQINGLTYKGISTKFLLPLQPEDVDNLVKYAEDELDEAQFNFALPILAYGYWEDRKPIAKAIKSYLVDYGIANKETVSTLHSTMLSVAKPVEVISFTPEVEQFPKSLTDLKLTYSDFLGWLYDDAEIDMMSLHIGRAANFPQGAIPAGETTPVEHSYRNLVIIQSEPDFGKSQFIKWLFDSARKLGLRGEVIQDLGKQFGHGQWVTSAMSYMDDTTEKGLHYAFNSELLKTVCSNGSVNVESKGVNHVTAKAITAPFVLANDIDARHLANCDAGNANRIKILACKNSITAQITAKVLNPSSPLYGVEALKPMDIVDHLTDKAGVTRDVLGAYFMRLCLDHFESYSRDKLKEKVSHISNDLYYNYSTNGMFALTKASLLAYILKEPELGLEDLKRLQVNCVGAGNSAALLFQSFECLADLASRVEQDASGKVKGLIRQHWENTGRAVSHPWIAFRNYSLSELCALGVRAADAKEMLKNRVGKNSASLDSIYSFVLRDLKDIKGNPTTFSVSRIETAFTEALIANIDTVVNTFKFIKTSDELALEHFQKEKPIFAETLRRLSSVDSTVQLSIPNNWFMSFITPRRTKKSLF